MNLRDMRYFVALADELQFSRTARKLAITQPSLSQKIRGLEIELGVRLFERGTRHVNLTGAGQTFLSRVRAILADIEQATEAARRAERGETGHIRIGFVNLAGLDVLPPLLRRFRAKYPDIGVGLFERSSEEQARNIADGALDIGIVREPKSIAGLASRHIVDDLQILVMPRDHALAHKRSIHLHELQNENFVMFPRKEGTAMYDRIIGAFGRAGFSPHIVQEATMMTTTIGLVAAKIGVSIVPSVASRIHHADVVYRALAPQLTIDTGLIWSKNTVALNSALASFLDISKNWRGRKKPNLT